MRKIICACVTLFTLVGSVPAVAQTQPPSFATFIDGLRSAPQAAAPQAAVPHTAGGGDEKRAYLLQRYRRLEAGQVRHSFVDDNDGVFDCIPAVDQPSLTENLTVMPTAPDLPEPPDTQADAQVDVRAHTFASPMRDGRPDRWGNARYCSPGTVPVQRVTLDDLGRFGTMREFYRKTPSGVAPSVAGSAVPSVVAISHRYAHAYQEVNNVGGHSFLNVWRPLVGSGIFSLSQQWYIGGSGRNLQTVEAGWQVYPQLYGNRKPTFFVYWTADGYNYTGCYNLTCPGFVQTSNTFAIGAAIAPWSQPGGSQVEIEVSWRLSDGRWWLYVNGTSSADAVGYIPVSVYGDGALSTGATMIDYGGETVGTDKWPQMGSGRFPYKGYGQAAYQRTIYFFRPRGSTGYARLWREQLWPEQYAIRLQNTEPWMSSFYFGGPGGTD